MGPIWNYFENLYQKFEKILKAVIKNVLQMFFKFIKIVSKIFITINLNNIFE